ncbi:MAG: TonB-dependent receptor [Leptospiraceae bacterium]|nr:TonB-dependent receptor [Leptospiraceae bacterium]
MFERFRKGKIVFILFLFLLPSLAFSQAKGKIRGKVIDSQTGEPVFGATVIVRKAGASTRTDFDGKYELDVPAGSHKVEFIMMGFQSQSKSVSVSAGSTKTLNLTLGTQVLDEVVVEGRALNNTEASLLQLQKKSGPVSDGISEEAIQRSPDPSAGEVIRRVTGVTLIGGKYVFIRGLGERYSNTLLNDSFIPSTEPDKRVVPLDIFPSGVIKNLRIIKTFTPEDPAEFSGGILKIETQEYPDQFEARADLGIGMNYRTTGEKFLTFKGGNALGQVTSRQKLPSIISSLPDFITFQRGDKFGGLPSTLVSAAPSSMDQQWTPDSVKAPHDKTFSFSIGNTHKVNNGKSRFGWLVGSSYRRTYRFQEEKMRRYFAGNPISLLATDLTYLNSFQEQEAKVYNDAVLWGTNANLSYDIRDGQQVYVKFLNAVQADKNVRDYDVWDRVDDNLYKAITNNYVSRNLQNWTLGGNHSVNLFKNFRPHKLTWNTNYAEATRDQPDLRSEIWRRKNSSDLIPYTRSLTNPDGYRFFGYSKDTYRNYNVKYELPFNQWQGLQSKLKIGGLYSTRFKYFYSRGFDTQIGNSISADDRVHLYPIPGEVVFNPLNYFTGQRDFGERQSEFNAYNAWHNLKAYFAQVDMPIIPKLRFIGGARYEDSYQKVKTYGLQNVYSYNNLSYGCKPKSEDERVLLINLKICDSNNNGVGELATQDLLPSANFVYEYTPNVNLRLGYSETLTRPDLRELSPFAFSAFLGGNLIYGNSQLRRTYIHNYDARWEWYIKGTDYAGVGLFYKQLSSPIEMVGLPVAGAFQNSFSYTNAQNARIQGVEVDYRKDFDILTKLFTFETNLFFIKSLVNVISWEQFMIARSGLLDTDYSLAAYAPTNISRPLQGQSNYVFNLKLTYYFDKLKKASLGMFYNFFGDRIYAVGTQGTPDAYERGVGTTDLVFIYRRDDNLSFRINARNIMDTRFYIYQKDNLLGREMLYNSYRMGVSYMASLSYTF